MIAPAVLLALTLFAEPVDVLVLRSGHQIAVEGEVTLQQGKVVFRHPSGVLYSLPLAEVDIVATERANHVGVEAWREREVPESESPLSGRLRVSKAEKERLLKELEKSRGTPVARKIEAAPVVEEVEVRDRSEEMAWRAASKRLEEQVRSLAERVQMLRDRIEYLEDQIRTFIGMGMPGDQYGGNMIQLQDSRAMLEEAQLALASAQRELEDFREQARRAGILPGWLR
jgi:hypothetical protein